MSISNQTWPTAAAADFKNDECFADPVVLNTNVPRDLMCEPNVVLNAVSVFPSALVRLASYMNEGMNRSGSGFARYVAIGQRVHVGTPSHPVAWLSTLPIAFHLEGVKR